MRVMGIWEDNEDENVTLKPVKQSISSSDEVTCASGDIPVAPLHTCVQIWLPVFKIVLNDPLSCFKRRKEESVACSVCLNNLRENRKKTGLKI